MTTATLFSSVSYDQNLGGPPVPAETVVDAGGFITHADFTLTVTPSTGWAEAAVQFGPDNVNWPGQVAVYCAPGAGATTQGARFHYGSPSGGAVGGDGARYFKALVLNVSPGATATLTMVY